MIAAKAGEQLAPFLPQLVPRLYRYQFDPNLSIRQAMTSIWDALVTDKTLVGLQTSACTIESFEMYLYNPNSWPECFMLTSRHKINWSTNKKTH